jgi:hypothetical protein
LISRDIVFLQKCAGCGAAPAISFFSSSRCRGMLRFFTRSLFRCRINCVDLCFVRHCPQVVRPLPQPLPLPQPQRQRAQVFNAPPLTAARRSKRRRRPRCCLANTSRAARASSESASQRTLSPFHPSSASPSYHSNDAQQQRAHNLLLPPSPPSPSLCSPHPTSHPPWLLPPPAPIVRDPLIRWRCTRRAGCQWAAVPRARPARGRGQ